MIPHTIHYCWFGPNKLDEKALCCIASWKKHFPDYEIIQWNESNFDLSQILFMKQAYENKKYAFVSDVARLIIIYQHGGIYFDTDVEVIKSYTDILDNNQIGFLGFEQSGHIATGLGFGFEKGSTFLESLIDLYKHIDFNAYLTNLSAIACPILTTDYMLNNGLTDLNKTQQFDGICLYSSDYFSPINYETGKLSLKSTTHSIHWYSATWQSEDARIAQKRIRNFKRIFGSKMGDFIAGVSASIREQGILQYSKNKISKYILRRHK